MVWEGCFARIPTVVAPSPDDTARRQDQPLNRLCKMLSKAVDGAFDFQHMDPSTPDDTEADPIALAKLGHLGHNFVASIVELEANHVYKSSSAQDSTMESAHKSMPT